MNYYEQKPHERTWRSVILGFGNVSLEEIEPNIQRLAELFGSKEVIQV
jgi:DNA-binding transcriptional MocR family regulator